MPPGARALLLNPRSIKSVAASGRLIREWIRRGNDLLALYQLAYALFLPGLQRELLAPGFAEALAEVIAETRARTPLSAISVMPI